MNAFQRVLGATRVADAPGAPAAEARLVLDRSAWVVLIVLAGTNVLSFMDRSILNILGQPIKEALHFADWQLGLLSGLGFSAAYTVLGLPLARLADSRNRVNIITVCTLAWSAMTAVCGLATNFWQILLFRMGVGVGEAGCLPATQSLITDYFPPKRRATALAVFGMGIPLGALFGSILGGVIVDHWGWRAAFLVMGLPGMLFALVVKLVVKEPSRGALDAQPDPQAAPPTFVSTAKLLWRNPTAFHVIMAATTMLLVGTMSSTFMAPYLVRRYALSYTAVGLIISLTYLVGGICGNLAGGVIADWAGRRDQRWYLWTPAIGVALSVPLNMLAYAQGSWLALALLLIVPTIISMTYLAPSYAVLHNIVEPRMRATMIAMVGLVSSLLGGGLGPLLGGASIDLMAKALFGRYGVGAFTAACPGGAPPAGAAPHLAAACHAALADATQYALIGWTPLLLWPVLHFWLAARTIRRDAKF